MTQQESADNLIKGCQASNSQYVNVLRKHLLIALGATDPHDDDGSIDDVSGQPEPDVEADA